MKIFNILTLFLVAISFVAVGTNSALAATTPWLAESQLRGYVERNMGRTIYATKIECRIKNGKVEARFHTRPVTGNKPFHKWNFVIADPKKLQAAINRLPRSDRKDLVYQVKASSTPTPTVVCAIVWR